MSATPEPSSKARPAAEPATDPKDEVGGPYASYVLGVLVLVYIFNFIDRQILSILNDAIKADLGTTDAQMGFLYGTAFAVFYAVFGIPLGRLADVWVRRSLISVGLAFWSLMTALSGTARSFGALATYRIGVGVGEASASPAAFSMLSDYFTPERRATAIAIYSSGVYIGAGLGLFLGGWIMDSWNERFVVDGVSSAPFGLKGWQAAFFAVGLPGLVMAIWVGTLREPTRGMSEGLVQPDHPHPFREFFRELAAVLPGPNLWSLAQAGGGRLLVVNAVAAVGLALLAAALIAWLGTPAQWIALGIGLYVSFSWAQGLAVRDPATFTMILRSRAILYTMGGFSCLAFAAYGIGYWTAPFFMREHGVSGTEAGAVLGLTAAGAGFLGVVLGGVVADALRKRTRNGRIWVGLFTATAPVPGIVALLVTHDKVTAYTINVYVALFAGMWIGPAAATVNDLVMPRMRAIASALYILSVTFVGLALGPYTIGRLSGAFGGDLRQAMLISLVVYVPAVLLLLLSLRHLPREEASRLDRARAAGEKV